MNKNYIDIHADDYALSENSDNDIITLCQNEKLDSISIIPNLKIFDSSVKKYLEAKKGFYQKVKVSVHLNFLEGKALSSVVELPDLVDYDGYFTASWGNLFLWNYNPLKRENIKQELKTEIKAQINKCINSKIIDKNAIRLDSHHHTHMIPLVFEAMTEAIKENNFTVEYIRNTCDPLSFYLFEKGCFKHLSFANVIKCFILNHYSKKISRWLNLNSLKDSYVCGVFYSGLMDERILPVLPTFEDEAAEKNKICEVLFNPGLMYKTELTKEFKKIRFNDFHLSTSRKVEFNTCNRL